MVKGNDIMEILVVEDDVQNAELITENIAGWGYSAERTGTGRDALKKIKRKRFDLIILDIFLPDCEGHTLIPKFKEICSEVGIVTMTGHNSYDLELKVRLQGIYCYLLKPFKMNSLKEILDHLSNKKKAKAVYKERLN